MGVVKIIKAPDSKIVDFSLLRRKTRIMDSSLSHPLPSLTMVVSKQLEHILAKNGVDVSCEIVKNNINMISHLIYDIFDRSGVRTDHACMIDAIKFAFPLIIENIDDDFGDLLSYYD